MAAPRADLKRRLASLLAATVVGVLGVLGGCANEPTDSAPLPTIGLGSGLDAQAVAALDDALEDALRSGARNAGDIDTVVMIGDSITAGALARLEERFAALGVDAVIEAFPGKRMVVSVAQNPSGASVAATLAAEPERDPARELWVVALGTNDISQYAGPSEIAGAVNDVLAAVSADAAVVWVDTHIVQRAADTETVNLVIRERVARRGNAVVAPWSAFAGDAGVLTGDGVHPTTAGNDVFAKVVVDTVAEFLHR